MTQQQALQLFEERKVRTIWDDEKEKWYFSIVDVVAVLTDSDYQTARKYWKVLKGRIAKEGNELVTICYQLKIKELSRSVVSPINAKSLAPRKETKELREAEI